MLAAASLERAIAALDQGTRVIVAVETAWAIAACPAAADPVIRAPSEVTPEGSAETARERAAHAVLPALAVEEAVAGAAVAVAGAGERIRKCGGIHELKTDQILRQLRSSRFLRNFLLHRRCRPVRTNAIDEADFASPAGVTTVIYHAAAGFRRVDQSNRKLRCLCHAATPRRER